MAQFRGYDKDGNEHIIEKDMSFEELWGFSPKPNSDHSKERTEVLKELLTQVTKLVVRNREIQIHKHWVSESYISEKKWRSAVDFTTNRVIMKVLRALGVDLDEIHELYKQEGLESPTSLEKRDPENSRVGKLKRWLHLN